MKIVKYKKGSNGKYIISLENDTKLSLYEETILEFNLLLTKDVKDIEEITNYNLQYEVYYTALKSINSRFKSVSETRTFLKNKEFPDELIDSAINKLVKQGYLNDRVFAKLYINNQIVTTSRGPLRIKKDLLDKGVSNSIIDEELVEFNEDIQLEKIDKFINKSIKSNHSRGGVILKSKIFNDLKTLGAALASSGSVALYHMENVTPEWKDTDKDDVEDYMFVSDKNILETRQNLTTTDRIPDLICLGCPHASLEEIKQVAAIVEGKTIKNKLWICTSVSVKATADRMGYTQLIEAAGGNVVCDTCMVVAPIEDMGFEVIGVNSAKAANYVPSMCGLDVVYDDVENLIRFE